MAVSEQGFAFLQGNTFLAGELRSNLAEFSREWSDLPADPYISNESPYRFRRHARVLFDSDTSELEVLPAGDYEQATSHNPLFGGIKRRFSPIVWSEATRRILRHLVEASAGQVLRLPGPSVINIHLVRIIGTLGAAGSPAPEGPHRDGFDFISVHLVGRDVDDGGETTVLTEDGEVLSALTLRDPLDAVFIDDRKFRHYTSPIIAADRESHRDVILMSFEDGRRPHALGDLHG